MEAGAPPSLRLPQSALPVPCESGPGSAPGARGGLSPGVRCWVGLHTSGGQGTRVPGGQPLGSETTSRAWLLAEGRKHPTARAQAALRGAGCSRGAAEDPSTQRSMSLPPRWCREGRAESRGARPPTFTTGMGRQLATGRMRPGLAVGSTPGLRRPVSPGGPVGRGHIHHLPRQTRLPRAGPGCARSSPPQRRDWGWLPHPVLKARQTQVDARLCPTSLLPLTAKEVGLGGLVGLQGVPCTCPVWPREPRPFGSVSRRTPPRAARCTPSRHAQEAGSPRTGVQPWGLLWQHRAANGAVGANVGSASSLQPGPPSHSGQPLHHALIRVKGCRWAGAGAASVHAPRRPEPDSPGRCPVWPSKDTGRSSRPGPFLALWQPRGACSLFPGPEAWCGALNWEGHFPEAAVSRGPLTPRPSASLVQLSPCAHRPAAAKGGRPSAPLTYSRGGGGPPEALRAPPARRWRVGGEAGVRWAQRGVESPEPARGAQGGLSSSPGGRVAGRPAREMRRQARAALERSAVPQPRSGFSAALSAPRSARGRPQPPRRGVDALLGYPRWPLSRARGEGLYDPSLRWARPAPPGRAAREPPSLERGRLCGAEARALRERAAAASSPKVWGEGGGGRGPGREGRVTPEGPRPPLTLHSPHPGGHEDGTRTVQGAGVMSARELVARLCRQGDQHLASGEPPLATAFYLAAFSCHAPSAVRRVRAALAEARGAAVVATLEAWCRGDGQIPAIHWDGMAVVSLTGAQASAFLATLCPDHPAAALHSLAGLLARGRHPEVVRRCSALLDARSPQSLELRLTRALARVLSGAQAAEGVADYLQAFTSSTQRAVAFVRTHQQPYLPVLVCALQDYAREPGAASPWDRNCQALLKALDPEGTWGTGPAPEALLRAGRYEDCHSACSRALEPHCAGGRPQGEPLAALLVTRAAAAFFLESGTQAVLLDLHEAFRHCPPAARKQLEAVLSAGDLERLWARAQEAADSGFAGFQEVVRRRPELREDSGRELLAPVKRALRVLLRVAPPGARPALGARLAECLLLGGNAAAARALCERLLRPARPDGPVDADAGSRAPLLALRGFCALHAGDTQRAREDFQEVVERGPPHPSSCVRALCGRGLLRVLVGSAFLGALDYVTACRLRPEETLLVTKAYVPWNRRGLLLAVLREEGRRMLQRSAGPGSGRRGPAELDLPAPQEGDAWGVHQLATLLVELDKEDEASALLVADALYLLGRPVDAHKVLLATLARRPQAAPVLVRLALLQLGRGFSYDAEQLVKKVIQSGDTACLAPTLDVFRPEDRQLLSGHCHSRALTILRARPAGAESAAHTREAIAYLSLAIFAAGSRASDSLLARARCYGLLGRRKTALFDLDRLLQAQPRHVPALCGRALLHLALGQRKSSHRPRAPTPGPLPTQLRAHPTPQEAGDDFLTALKLDPPAAVAEIRTLKPEARTLIAQGLSSRCRADLNQLLDAGARLGQEDAQGLRAAGEALVSIAAERRSQLLLLADVLTAAGSFEEAGARLQEALHPAPAPEAALARRGLLGLKKGHTQAAARDLQGLAETDPQDLGFLLRLLEPAERQGLAQVAAQEAGSLLECGRPGQALGYCSLAVLAGGGSAQHLRLRAACLAELEESERALGDLDRVLRERGPEGGSLARAEDLCSRGRLLLRLGDGAGAVGAFAEALRLAPGPTQASLWGRPGRAPTARVFLRHGQRCLEEGRLAEAWAAAQSGLLADPQHSGLQRLKARVRREASPGCRLH
ncbi:Tetratricopeptide repeat protein 34 [Galemys pyrenaicus]|uniref:Tetratricopeptide repeat protein 34 n=1 Tax=Galemys pyrenaicus TaxID=202257 RepID=A0A8J6DEC7_GALPY|nr:Tetratricopeptide repeat protein 34 [Galemys pyrenaicus]